MSPKVYTTITGIIFLVVAAAHVVRLFGGYEFRVGVWDIPAWASIVAIAVGGYLSYMGFRIATRS